MKKRIGLLGAAMALTLTAAPMLPVMAAEQPENTVEVSGTSTTTVTADEAQFQFAFTDTAATQEEAQTQNTAAVNQALAYLAAEGVDSVDITTVSYYVWPDYSWDGSNYVINGYIAESVYEVTGQPIAMAGHLLTGLGQLGADSIDSLTYSASGYEAAYDQALTEAVTRAAEKAAVLAKAAGKELGDVVTITENSSDASYQNASQKTVTLEADTTGTTAPDVPLEPEEIEIDANVTVTFSLK